MGPWIHLIEFIQLKDVIDIFLLTALIYQVLINIKGTRAIHMALGLSILLALYTLAGQWELTGTRWALGHVFSSFVFILVILFQDPLKAWLASVAAGGRNSSWKDDRSNVDAIEEALRELSRSKSGALMVFQRSHGLSNFIETGARLDALVSSELLLGLFGPQNPLHDGAVIIGSSRVQAAACRLPLTELKELDRPYGFRHRAAIGVSEETDAIVLAVSEEDGRISLAVKGELRVASSVSQAMAWWQFFMKHGRRTWSLWDQVQRRAGTV